MKNNQPVTNAEYLLDATDTIVSKTDTKGIITYINDDFVRISGFSREELIGASHNIVRHPDMPPEAFADLWANLNAGKSWSGCVKNRSKNGDFYWVRANTLPLYEEGRLVGYTSVRSRLDRDTIAAVEQGYRQIREGRDSGLAIQDGKFVRRGPLDRIGLNKGLSIRSRLIAVIAILSVLLIAIGVFGLWGLSQSNAGLRSVYQDRTVVIGHLNGMLTGLQNNRLAVANGVMDPQHAPDYADEMDGNIELVNESWKEYMAVSHSPDEARLAERFAQERKKLLDEGLRPAQQALRKRDIALAAQIMTSSVRPLFVPVQEGASELIMFQLDAAKAEYAQSERRFAYARAISIGMILAGLAIALSMGVMLMRGIGRGLAQAMDVAARIAAGDLNREIDIRSDDEIGRMLLSLRGMQVSLQSIVAEIKDIVEAVAVRGDFGVRMDMTGKAGYGRELSELLNQLAGITGSAMNDVTEVAGALAKGDLSKKITRDYPGVFGQTKAGVNGTVDALNRIVGEIKGIVENAALRGDFSARIPMDGKQGYTRELSDLLNRLSEVTEQGLGDVLEVVHALAEGDLTRNVERDYPGIFGELTGGVNRTAENLRELVGRVRVATDTIDTASAEIASGNSDLSARTEEQAASLEETASSIEELTSAVRMNAENALQASRLAAGASDVAEQGGAVVGQVVASMDSISESAHKIAEIIAVIDGIAFQTNILALNAAVEAARAGEQGRGFAVVASEVRNLAHRSSAAAKEIRELIGDSLDKVDGGNQLAMQAGKTMDGIVVSIGRVRAIIGEIADASTEQSAGIEQVNQAVVQMDQATQQNAALVEQAAAAAQALEEQAHNLSASVGVFRVS